jgi:hypothetical protein
MPRHQSVVQHTDQFDDRGFFVSRRNCVMPRAKSKPVKRVAHGDRRERRKQMAADVRSGKDRAAVARKFKVSLATVHYAVAEFKR